MGVELLLHSGDHWNEVADVVSGLGLAPEVVAGIAGTLSVPRANGREGRSKTVPRARASTAYDSSK